MGLVDDLRLEEEVDTVERVLSAAIAPYRPEAQYRGALRVLRRIGPLIEAERKATAQVSGMPVSPPAQPQRWDVPGLKMWERTFKYLEAHPRAPYSDMALALYAKVDDTTRANVRSQIDQLKKRGLVRAIADGVCEVIPEAERAPTDEETSE